jgi:hypothetical protein
MYIMKRTVTFISMLLLGSASMNAQITIQAADIPVPGTFNVISLNSTVNPLSGNNQTWNYGSTIPTANLTNEYFAETDAFWTALGVDVYVEGFKEFSSSVGYLMWTEIDKATTGMLEKGVSVPAQGYDLSAFTGSATDSLKIPAQELVYSTTKVLMPFPLTSTYANTYTSARNVLDFTLNAPAIGLNNTPCQLAYYDVRKDSIAGWGTLRVYTPGGPSAPIEVLMSKNSSYTIDSFYIGGTPASPALQAAFQVTQGQKSTVRNSYNFYRKGYFNYLLRLFYGADSSFTTISTAWSHTDGVAPTGVSSDLSTKFMTMLYPNPSAQSDIHVKILHHVASSFTRYTIHNIFGQVVHAAAANWQGGELVCATSQLPKGHYVLSIHDEKSGETITEKFQMN